MIDLTGQIFGELTVLHRAPKPEGSKSTSVFWLCRCSCGNEKVISGNVLRQGKARSCGCKTSEFLSKSHIKDITGQHFGNLRVIKQVERPKGIKYGGAFYECLCDCGQTTVVESSSLRSGRTKSCGCHIWQVENLTGKKYGKLTVIGQDHKRRSEGNGTYWICQCDCGNITSVQDNNLKYGNVQSCGCLTSVGEMKIEQLLQENNIDYKKQYSFSDLKGIKGGLLRFDFAIFNKDKTLLCLIEFQGEQHYSSQQSKYFDESVLITDKMKKNYCKEHGISLYCIPYWKRNNLKIEDIFDKKYVIINNRNDEETV